MNRIAELTARLAELMQGRGLMLATAESCTGGMIAAACTDLAGSSAWFERGFVSYSNAAKTQLLGVLADCIASHGAVSEPVARAMAQGALTHSAAQVAVAVTGVAGPGGGSPDKPVGTVWIAWAWQLPGSTQVQRLAQVQRFAGEREAVRRQSVIAALEGLLQLLRRQTP